MSITKKRLVVFLDPEKATKITTLAADKKWSITDLIEEAVDCYLADQEKSPQ